MSKILLVLPSVEHKEMVMDYKCEFEANNENLAGTGGLQDFDVFEDWLQWIKDNSHVDTVNQGLVVDSTFLAFTGEKLVGMVNIRHELNDYLMKFGGHIGYSVRRSEKTILNKGGFLEHELLEDGVITQRYWIELSN